MSETQDLFPLPLGQALRDEGMQRALDHAEAEEPSWGTKAFTLLQQFVVESDTETFLTEDVRWWAHGKIDPPPDARAWGAILTKAARANLIQSYGYAKVADPARHRGVATLWKIV